MHAEEDAFLLKIMFSMLMDVETLDVEGESIFLGVYKTDWESSVE